MELAPPNRAFHFCAGCLILKELGPWEGDRKVSCMRPPLPTLSSLPIPGFLPSEHLPMCHFADSFMFHGGLSASQPDPLCSLSSFLTFSSYFLPSSFSRSWYMLYFFQFWLWKYMLPLGNFRKNQSQSHQIEKTTIKICIYYLLFFTYKSNFTSFSLCDVKIFVNLKNIFNWL